MLHYRESGTGPPLVLLHAFPLAGGMYEAQLEALSGSFRVLVPDLPGFGESLPFGVGALAMDAMADEVLAGLDQRRIERVVVGGTSMGGYVAMSMVRRDPTRVAGIVLMNTHARADDDPAKAGRESTALRVLENGMQVLVDAMLPRLLSPEAPNALRMLVRRMILENEPPGSAAALRGMALRADSREILSRFAGPALIVSGGQDAVVPKERSEELVTLISGAEHLHLPDAGHLAALEAPEAINAALERFSRKVFAH